MTDVTELIEKFEAGETLDVEELRQINEERPDYFDDSRTSRQTCYGCGRELPCHRCDEDDY